MEFTSEVAQGLERGKGLCVLSRLLPFSLFPTIRSEENILLNT